MSSLRLTIAVFLLSIVSIASAATQRSKSAASKQHKAVTAQTQAPAPVPQQAVLQRPATPEQGPSSPPEVTFHGGQLTILARNSTMGDVLNAVRSKTGAAVEMPPASSERVVGQFGPGAPRDVMAQLLNGSHYDYVLVGSPADPRALKKVVLSVRPLGPEPAPQPAMNPNQGYSEANQPVPQVDQDQPPEEVNTDVQPEQPEPMEQEEPHEQPPQTPNGGPVVKTPEQLLRELQQQQQQQQQQNGQPPQQ
jgi:hypothetical protein